MAGTRSPVAGSSSVADSVASSGVLMSTSRAPAGIASRMVGPSTAARYGAFMRRQCTVGAVFTRTALTLLLFAGLCARAPAQDAIDARLLEDIARIRAIDDHMHGEAVDPARASRWKDEAPLG